MRTSCITKGSIFIAGIMLQDLDLVRETLLGRNALFMVQERKPFGVLKLEIIWIKMRASLINVDERKTFMRVSRPQGIRQMVRQPISGIGDKRRAEAQREFHRDDRVQIRPGRLRVGLMPLSGRRGCLALCQRVDLIVIKQERAPEILIDTVDQVIAADT